mmetsp:Transcript_5662/g.25553  ORF Transcript_5662/g.25553 Transcript_5662/m.25553 type:complete len:213 (+) Transcript_5662:1638-2276(+)
MLPLRIVEVPPIWRRAAYAVEKPDSMHQDTDPKLPRRLRPALALLATQIPKLPARERRRRSLNSLVPPEAAAVAALVWPSPPLRLLCASWTRPGSLTPVPRLPSPAPPVAEVRSPPSQPSQPCLQPPPDSHHIYAESTRALVASEIKSRSPPWPASIFAPSHRAACLMPPRLPSHFLTCQPLGLWYPRDPNLRDLENCIPLPQLHQSQPLSD